MLILLAVLLGFLLAACIVKGVDRYIGNHPVKPIPAPWKAPAELNAEDNEWVQSQLEIAGVPRPKFQNLGHTKPKQAGRNRHPEYKHRPQAEIDKAVYHLKKLEESRRSNYDPATDSYYIGSRKISRQMYDYMVEDGVGNFIAYLEEPTYDTVWK